MHRIFHSIGHVVWMTCNLLAVVLLLTADLAMIVPPTKLHFLALMALGFELFAITNLIFAVSWLFSSRKSWSVISVLALLISITPLKATFSTSLNKSSLQSHSSEFNEEKPLNSLRILTYNTHLLQNNTPIEHNDLLRYVRNSGADIVCMQEYAVYKDKRYPTFQAVKNALTDLFPYTYFDFSIHNQRLQYGLAVYSKFPLIHKTTIPIHAEGNGANYCDVLVPTDNRTDTFRLFNNHLQSNSLLPAEIDSLLSKNAGHYTLHSPLPTKLARAYTQRTEQVQTIRQFIDDSPYPVIVCGDFNDIPVSYTYHQLSRNLKDAFLTTSFLRTGHTFVKRGLGIRIDYILHSDLFNATDCRIDHVNYSDHYPVTTTLVW